MKGSIKKYSLKGGAPRWRYRIDVVGANGERKQAGEAGFKREGDAENALRQALNDLDAGNIVAKDDRTFGAFFADWLEEYGAKKWQPTTIEQNRKRAAYAIRMFGNVKLQDLSSKRIDADLATLLTKGCNGGRPLSKKTVQDVYALVRQSLNKAVKRKLVTENVTDHVDRPKVPKREVESIELPEFEKLLRRVANTRYFVFCIFTADSGCRRGEVLALRWRNVNLDTGVVIIKESLAQTKEGLFVKPPKSGKQRKIEISRGTIRLLHEHRTRIEHEKQLYGDDYEDNDLVFCTPEGKYYEPDKVGNRISEFAKQAGVKCSMHGLRHFHASVHLSNGTPITAVSERLGHANANITLGVYAHMMKSDQSAAAKLWHRTTAKVVSREQKFLPEKATTDPANPVLVTFGDNAANLELMKAAK
jgi:integrase